MKLATFDVWKASLALVSFVYLLRMIVDLVEFYHIQKASIPAELVGHVSDAAFAKMKETEYSTFVFRFWQGFSIFTLITIEMGFCVLGRAWRFFETRFAPKTYPVNMNRFELEQSLIFSIGYGVLKVLINRIIQTLGHLFCVAVAGVRMSNQYFSRSAGGLISELGYAIHCRDDACILGQKI